jgi:hypothetical protein
MRQRKGNGSVDDGDTLPPNCSRNSDELARQYMTSLSDSVPALRPYIATAIPYAVATVTCVENFLPLGLGLYDWFVEMQTLLSPLRLDLLLPALAGIVMCLFGGNFSSLSTSVETYRILGWDMHAKFVKEQCLSIPSKNEEDEKNPLSQRRREMIYQSTKSVEPQKALAFFTGVLAALLSTLAALRIGFVKSLILGISIGHALEVPIFSVSLSVLESNFQEDYQRWAQPLLGIAIKSVCFTTAWFLQRIVVSLYSSIRGGTMFARNLLAYLDRIGFVHIRADDTKLPEAVGFVCAALGLWFQISTIGHTYLPFPLNFLLLPALLVEWLLEIISKSL